MDREEAIKIIRKNMPSDKSLPVYEAIQTLIPELAESEDERTRKTLIEALKTSKTVGELKFILPEPTREEAIAYLKKQKDLDKMIVVSPEVWDKAISDAYENGKKEGEKLKEQKQVDLSEMMVHKEPYIAPVPTPMVADEQKSAEWAELQSEFKNINEAFEDGKKEVVANPEKYGLTKQKPADFPTTDEEVKEFLETHPKVEVPEKYKTPDFVFSKQEYESHPIISKDTTSTKPVELDGKALLYTADKSYQIGFRDGVASVKPAEWSEDIIQKAVKEVGLTQYQIDWFKTNVFQPKREWSDEDEAAWGDLIWCIEQARKSAKDENDMGNIWFAENWVKNRLKSLRPQPKQEQNDYITPHKEFFKFIYDRLINVYKENPNVDYMRSFKERLDNLSFEEKQEWNEENEDMLNSCISSIEEAKENRYAYKETDGDTSYDHEIAWLKSIRNRVGKEFLQPHWKPSEEQIKAVAHAYNSFPNDCPTKSNLRLLYHDLEKLM